VDLIDILGEFARKRLRLEAGAGPWGRWAWDDRSGLRDFPFRLGDFLGVGGDRPYQEGC